MTSFVNDAVRCKHCNYAAIEQVEELCIEVKAEVQCMYIYTKIALIFIVNKHRDQ